MQFVIQKSKRIQRHYRYYISCNEHGIITFRFPPNAKNTLESARQYILNHRSTIERMQQRRTHNNQMLHEYLVNHPNMICVGNQWIHVNCHSIDSLSAMLYERAKILLDTYAAQMQLTYHKLTISYAKTYLGQCRHTKQKEYEIKIGYQNLLNSEELLCYLVVHELAHIRHPNHSSAFWREVACYCPNYPTASRALKQQIPINKAILKHYNLLPQRLC